MRIYLEKNSAKFHPDPVWNDRALVFFWRARTTRTRWVAILDQFLIQQESLANAKVSARQPWYIGRSSLNRPPLRIAQQYQRNLHIVEKYFKCATILPLTVRVYLHLFSHCCLPNMPTSAKFRENLNLQQFKVIQGRWFWYQSKTHIRIPISH